MLYFFFLLCFYFLNSLFHFAISSFSTSLLFAHYVHVNFLIPPLYFCSRCIFSFIAYEFAQNRFHFHHTVICISISILTCFFSNICIVTTANSSFSRIFFLLVILFGSFTSWYPDTTNNIQYMLNETSIFDESNRRQIAIVLFSRFHHSTLHRTHNMYFYL